MDRTRPWLQTLSCFATLTFFNVPDGKEEKSLKTKSFYNPIEVDVIIGLLKEFILIKGTERVSVGIIAGYAAQIREIRLAICKAFNLPESVNDPLQSLGKHT